MQSSAVMLPLSGVLQNFPDHVLKNYCFLLAGTHAFLRASCGVSELGVSAPRGCPSLPYCINRKDPCMSAFFYLKVTCSELSSSTYSPNYIQCIISCCLS